MQKQHMTVAILLYLLINLCFGCAAVKPYERENLSDRTMTFDANREEIAMEQHFLMTREGSIGGLGGAGGGCACN
jgi:hypothetical protein